LGETPHNAKQLKGINPSVMEIISNYDTNTYRAIYTVKLGENVYVLHCFNKKSNSGIKTPQKDIELIKRRMQAAKKDIK
jgi:phage-related protein